jgi:hypothetical protein
VPRACFINTASAQSRSRRCRRRRCRWRADARGEPEASGIDRARQWFARRSIDVCSAPSCARPYTVAANCSSGRAQSVQWPVSSTVRGEGRSRIQGRRLSVLVLAADGLSVADFFERGFRKGNFCRRGAFQLNSQRKTLTGDQYHPLRSLAALGFTDRIARFLAGEKLPSRNVSPHFSRPSASGAPNRARQVSSQTPLSCHCFSRRQQVAGEGNSSGRNRHAAPVCRIRRIFSKHVRLRCSRPPPVVLPSPWLG